MSSHDNGDIDTKSLYQSKDKPSARDNTYESDDVIGIAPNREDVRIRHPVLHNHENGRQTFTDRLHARQNTEGILAAKTPCTTNSSTKPTACLSSVMRPSIPGYLVAETDKRSKEEFVAQATDFLELYYEFIQQSGTNAHDTRIFEVFNSICLTGTYDLTLEELVFGIKNAWRNAPRCIGRIQWKNLEVFDCRQVETARGMFDAICTHLEFATNGGNIRAAISVFRQRLHNQSDFRVWNPQLINYAGYVQPDGSVIGDPARVEFTQLCEGLGWTGKGGMFDVLPLVLKAEGNKPEWFVIPPELVLEVNIGHPKYDWFADLGLKWYGVPCVADMMLDVGGLQFTAAPFNGWYMGTEIGARNFGDTNRYNMLEPIAKRIGLETSSTISLWKDLALIETNIAVLHSYNEAKVTITDHHSASESFMKHMENEQRLRGGCPADWVWIVPPISGSVCPVFHQEMLSYQLKPAFLYQSEAWKMYSHNKRKKPLSTLKVVATAVRCLTRIMRDLLANRPALTILYGTETGKSERFANRISDVFNTGFNVQVSSMSEYDTSRLSSESFLLVVTSTFGSGDPPTNGETFNRTLKKQMKDTKTNGNSTDGNNNSSGTFWYSVFGLGSTAYPDFCAFASNVDHMLEGVGGQRLTDVHKGDELGGQEEAFQIWARSVFTNACNVFPIHHGVNKKAILTMLGTDTSEVFKSYRLKTVTRDSNPDPLIELEKIHEKKLFPCTIIARRNLQPPSSSRSTILVQLDTQGSPDLSYDPGDHVVIFPTNDRKLVQRIVGKVTMEHSLRSVLRLEMRQDNQEWKRVKRLPPCSILEALSKYLDITTPPTPDFLRMLASYAKAPHERDHITQMGKGGIDYKTWISASHPHLAEVLNLYPSVNVPAWFLLDHLPLLTPRYYSISSCPRVHQNEIHITVAVVKYWAQGSEQSFPPGSFHKGVCSSWLEELRFGDLVPIYIKKAASFHLPSDTTKPVLLVGNGTGIAPFRSFWQRRKLQMALSNQHHRKITLVFGCRHPKVDDIYRDETSAAEKSGALTKVLTAYSRVPGKPKKYVQDIIKETPDLICKYLLEEEGHIYVCGDNIMAVDVRKTLVHILGSKDNMTEVEAEDYINNMRESGRYHEDLFGVVIRLPEEKPKVTQTQRFTFISMVDLVKSKLFQNSN